MIKTLLDTIRWVAEEEYDKDPTAKNFSRIVYGIFMEVTTGIIIIMKEGR